MSIRCYLLSEQQFMLFTDDRPNTILQTQIMWHANKQVGVSICSASVAMVACTGKAQCGRFIESQSSLTQLDAILAVMTRMSRQMHAAFASANAKAGTKRIHDSTTPASGASTVEFGKHRCTSPAAAMSDDCKSKLQV